jgi:hypothetical protein
MYTGLNASLKYQHLSRAGKETDNTKKLRLLKDYSGSSIKVSPKTLNRIVCLLNLLSSGFQHEINALCRVLPLILEDFLPSRQVFVSEK